MKEIQAPPPTKLQLFPMLLWQGHMPTTPSTYNPLSGILHHARSQRRQEVRCKLDPQHSLWLGVCTLHSLHCLLVSGSHLYSVPLLFIALFCQVILGL